MSQSIARSSPDPSLRGFFVRAWADPESRSTLVGVAGVVVFYLLLWILSPYLFKAEPVTLSTHSRPKPRTFNIQIAPDMFAKPAPKPPPPKKFVETNPDAPENIPDKTNNFAAQNQQVAQEEPTKDGKSDMPALQGKKDFDNTQIVSGQLAKPVEMTEAVPPPPDVTPPQDKTVQPPKQEQNPLTGFEKKIGESLTGIGSNIAKIQDNVKPIPNRIEGAKNAPLNPDAFANQPAIDPSHPRPRPTVVKQQQVRPAILAERLAGTANIGPTAVDARWSAYGAYLQRLIETVDQQWNKVLGEGKTFPPSGTQVSVKFILNADGNVTKIVNVDSTSSDSGGRACVSAITDRAPYGVWPEDMKAVLGEEQVMTFTFYYQAPL